MLSNWQTIGACLLAPIALGLAYVPRKTIPAREVPLPAVADVPAAPVPPPAIARARAEASTPSRYGPEASWRIRDALVLAARALEERRAEEAMSILTDPHLSASAGVVAERHVALRVDAPRGSIDRSLAERLGRERFDASYAIGDLHRRGVRLGLVSLVASASSSPSSASATRAPLGLEAAFRTPDDYMLFARMTVVSYMEPWIRVWQDVAGVRPVSELTELYLASRGGASAGWSDVDVLATLHDLGVRVPAELVSDGRFPAWQAFEAWLGKVEITANR